jgi:hypothetical protein
MIRLVQNLVEVNGHGTFIKGSLVLGEEDDNGATQILKVRFGPLTYMSNRRRLFQLKPAKRKQDETTGQVRGSLLA